jgi:glycosyltransferase involved in cell wall biosynthesis
MTKIVGIYRLNFPETSETFIRAQMGAYRQYKPIVYAKQLLGETTWPVNAVSAHGKWAQRHFLATRSPRWHCNPDQEQPQLLHAHFGVDGVYALPLARKLAIPLVTTFHGFDVLTHLAWWVKHPSLPVAVYLSHLRELKSRGARFIAVSRFVEQALIRAGYPQEKIVQHYIGVDTAKFQPNPGMKSPTNRYILSVGRHVGFKGIDVLLKAFAHIANTFPDVKLIQVGAGPDTATLKALGHTLGLGERVQFLGAQPNARVIELLQGADMFALPSCTQESGRTEALGIVFNEASACGVPIAATRSGGIPEVVLHGETGLLSAEGDSVDLARNLATLLSDATVREKFGMNGRSLVCRQFDLNAQTAKLERIYDEVVR